tara:strand:- start:274 stop:1545 length:1272 start_codon:yes stop_codon:yes gene_type:complete
MYLVFKLPLGRLFRIFRERTSYTSQGLSVIKRFIIAFVLLVLVCGGIVGFNLFRDEAIEQFFANRKAPASTVSTMVVEPITWTPGIDALGTVGAAQGVDLTVETSGIVKEILFSANERVTQDKVLVQLDDGVQKADLAAATTQAALDQQTLDRARELKARGVGTEVSVDTAQAAASASKSLAVKYQAVLDQKQVRAPFSGTMGIPRIDTGQYISPGKVIATLQDLETMRIDFTVPEQRFDDLKIGQRVVLGLTTDTMPFFGLITGIDPKVDSVSRLVSVRAEINNAEGHLNPGQFLQVRVELPTEEGVLSVPQTALVSSLYGDFIYVVRKAESAAPAADENAAAPAEPDADVAEKSEAEALIARQIFVTAGRRADGMVEISKGLSAGDQVVTAGQNRLYNGASVVIDNSVVPDVGNTSEAVAQ